MPSLKTSLRMLYEDLRIDILILGKSHEYMRGTVWWSCTLGRLAFGINWLQSLHVALPREWIVCVSHTGWTWLDQAGPVALSHGHVEKQIILPSDRRGEALIHLPSTWWVWGIPALNWANIYIMYSICPKVSDKVNIFDSFHFSVARLNSVSSTSAVSHLDQTHISYESWQLWSWIWNPLLGMTPKHFNFQVTIGFGIIFHLC